MPDVLGPDTYAAVQWGWQWAQSAPGTALKRVAQSIPLTAALLNPKAAAIKFGSKWASGLFPDPPPVSSLPVQYQVFVRFTQVGRLLEYGSNLPDLAIQAIDAGVDAVKDAAWQKAKNLYAALLDDGEVSGVVVVVRPVWFTDP